MINYCLKIILSLAIKQQRNKIQLSGDILDIQANVGIGFQQEYSFIPEDVEVRFSVEEGAVDEALENSFKVYKLAIVSLCSVFKPIFVHGLLSFVAVVLS